LLGRLIGLLFMNRARWGICVFPEQRVQVTPTRYRVPDIVVAAGAEPDEQIFTSPPFICIEILSKDDRMAEVQTRIDDSLAFGVRYVWVVDSGTRRAWHCTAGGLHEVRELRTADPEILLPLAELFD
jgi:Uma2 family endonuclease